MIWARRSGNYKFPSSVSALQSAWKPLRDQRSPAMSGRASPDRTPVKYHPSSDLLSSLYSNKDYWDQTVDRSGWKYNFSWWPETTQNISIIPNMSGQWLVIVIVIPAAMLVLVKTLKEAYLSSQRSRNLCGRPSSVLRSTGSTENCPPPSNLKIKHSLLDNWLR